MSIKKVIGKLHLWLGFTSGIVIFIVAVTGCILAFEQEIKSLTQPYLHSKTVEGAVPLPPSRLRAIAEKELPGKPATWVTYAGKDKSASVMFYKPDPEYYYQVFINPYSGQVLKVWNEEGDFFHFILHGHFYLWLPEKIGQPVVASFTLVFVCMLITGLVLWWPKKKAAAKQRFSIKWSARWRRVNYDLHNVLGFYMMGIGLILAITGLVWGFQWFSKSMYFVTSGGKPLAEEYIPVSDTTRTPARSLAYPVDKVWQHVARQAPANAAFFLSYPEKKADAILASVNYRPGTYYKADLHYYDQYTLKEVPNTGPFAGKYAKAGFADKLRRMNYDIHVGAIFGLAGKVLVFFASLICASLPVTGIYIWWGRRSKKKKAASRTPAIKAAPLSAVNGVPVR